MIRIKKILKDIYNPLSKLAHKAWAVISPASYAKYVYKKTTGKKLDLRNPKEFSEKNFWLRVYSDLSRWTDLADKYQVREYVEQCGLGDTLVKLYGVWEKTKDIDFSILPEKFVLKTNHGFNKLILVPDKKQLDVEKTKWQLNKWLKEKHGLVSFEPHYWKIQRKIIAEEYLQDSDTYRLSLSLIDYKFYCINGEPEIIKVMFDRKINKNEGKNGITGPGYKTFAVDLNWKFMPEVVPESQLKVKTFSMPKPKCLDEMIRVSRILSKPFPQVRVDLYEVNRKVYFGEMTFTPGNERKFTSEYLLKLGEKMDLSLARLRTKRFIIS